MKKICARRGIGENFLKPITSTFPTTATFLVHETFYFLTQTFNRFILHLGMYAYTVLFKEIKNTLTPRAIIPTQRNG